VSIARCIAAASRDEAIGRNVKIEVFDQIKSRVGTLAEVFWKDVVVAATQEHANREIGASIQADQSRAAVGAAINRIAGNAATNSLWRLSVRIRHAALRLRGMPRRLPRGDFEEIAVSPHNLVSLGVYEYLHDVHGWQEPTRPMQGLWKLAKSAGWIAPYEHTCWISERPAYIRTDARGRLHCADGPALRYPDGWRAYAWKGVWVPAWMIEHPERITTTRIDDTLDPIWRNCMIDIMTPERFIKLGLVARVAEDETGILWRKVWTYRGVPAGSWTVVEVVNGTTEQDGSRKRFFLRVPSAMRTAREAVAWTYGLTADQYARLELRT
jgi:hypothetical protein